MIETPPSATGTWSVGPFACATWSDVMGTSVAPKFTVPFWNCVIPVLEPTNA